MDRRLLFTLVISCLGYTNALDCLGETCLTNQHHEDHQKCIGSHHSGDHCFCLEQACVDEIARRFTTAPVMSTIVPVVTAMPTTVPVVTAMPTTVTARRFTTTPIMPTTVPVVTAMPTTVTAKPDLHIKAISCFGTTCYAPSSCSVHFENGVPVSGKCVPIVSTSCGPLPTTGNCECDSKLCMSLMYTLQSQATTPQSTVVSTMAEPVTCNICGDLDVGIPCSNREVASNVTTTKCPSDKRFCMTDLYQDANGNEDIFKRCVDENTCNTKWINESADQDYCTKYGTVLNPSQFQCHFCCTEDRCNTNILPPASTLVAKATGK